MKKEKDFSFSESDESYSHDIFAGIPNTSENIDSVSIYKIRKQKA